MIGLRSERSGDDNGCEHDLKIASEYTYIAGHVIMVLTFYSFAFFVPATPVTSSPLSRKSGYLNPAPGLDSFSTRVHQLPFLISIPSRTSQRKATNAKGK